VIRSVPQPPPAVPPGCLMPVAARLGPWERWCQMTMTTTFESTRQALRCPIGGRRIAASSRRWLRSDRITRRVPIGHGSQFGTVMRSRGGRIHLFGSHCRVPNPELGLHAALHLWRTIWGASRASDSRTALTSSSRDRYLLRRNSLSPERRIVGSIPTCFGPMTGAGSLVLTSIFGRCMSGEIMP